MVAVVIAFVAVIWLGWASPAAAKMKAKASTYTAAQIAELQGYAGEVAAMRDRMVELQALIQAEDWTFTRNFIHGPLGELRVKMSTVARGLLPDAQKPARQLVKQVSEGLNDVDAAAKLKNYRAAIRSYGLIMSGLADFFKLVPQA